ncbi:1,4-dihydroxy-2-naphthoate polyprenyltransferase [Parabacteroides acidifaciens]|uniref:1,4-dihydroxy-2-naphthoate octaprenyltransferase n=1 Tax=Parabacteroides acidifaciens TaxID=2290935 RepID=A0A3D8H8X6_9BACT|nr:1,4-dihydroxy-2-naphthoate polyprenyltransferase [Parabacteroides acidifaciens]MBC8603821.1 1,4-dihydroxy-2-naphthoate polyprenyltransferase [Parabacteroides acidifaciens]RDU47424.1 1,4-dihydroxy-2-naphthoate polyprenyltransferase [Parabacteroides acidifaciens]
MEHKKSIVGAWVEAARPKTLPASVSPVLLGSALAYYDGSFDVLPAILCLLVALFAQIASNFANDYFDFKKGADREDRLGPERAVAQGWISPKAMLAGTFVMLGLACLFGLMLIFFADWRLLLVGVAIAVCVLAYSAGPFPLAYNGLGDVCVLLFYGIIPVCFTYYIQTLSFSLLSFLLSVALGLLSVNILVVNNYRDYEQDKAARKRTTIVLFGRRFGRVFYILNECMAFILILPLLLDAPWWALFLFGILFALCFYTTRELFILEGKALNRTLGHTARNVFFFALILSVLFVSIGSGVY